MTKHFERKATHEEVDALFGSHANTALAQKIRTEDPATYFRIRSQAEADGKVGPPSYATPQELAERAQPKSDGRSEAILAAMSKYDYAESKRFFAGDHNNNPTGGPTPAKLMKDNPQEYAERQLAAIGHKVLNKNTRPVVADQSFKAPVPNVPGERLMDLDKVYLDFFNLPVGTKVTFSEFDKMATVKMKADGERFDKLVADAEAIANKYKPGNDDNGGES